MSVTKPKSSHRTLPHSAPHSDSQESLMVRRLGLKRLRHFTSLISKTMKTGKPNTIHDIRVASRRLQQILDYLYPPPRPPSIRRLRNRLRRSRQALGKVRDNDVFIASIETHLKSKRIAQRPLLTVIHKQLGKRRTKLIKKAHEAFDKYDVIDLCLELEDVLSNVDRQPGANGTPPLMIDVTLKQLWRDLASEVAKSLRKPRPANIHLVRIKAKRLRYLLEVAGELGNRHVDTSLMWLRRIQQCLGSWHDLDVQADILLKMNSRRPLSSRATNDDDLLNMIRKMHIAKEDSERVYLKLITENPTGKRLRQWMTKHQEV